MSRNVEKALITAFVTTNSSFSLPVARENVDYTPDPQTAYAEISVIQNDREVLSFKHSDELTGIFQTILRYPLDEGAGNIKDKAQEIIDAFPLGTKLTFGGDSVVIMGSRIHNGVPEDGWFKLVVTLNFVSYLRR